MKLTVIGGDRANNRPWMHGIRVQARVILTLMIRDALSRYGHENLGFFWIIAEPLIFCVAIMTLWSIAHLTHGDGVDVIPFALTGYSFITMWRHITGRSVGVIRHHNNLSYHRMVDPFDCVLAIALLEVIACFTAFIIAYFPLWLIGYCPPLSDPLLLVSGFALSGIFAFGVGLTLAGLSQSNSILHHLVPAIMYMSLPLTGIFTLQAWLPDSVRNLLLWSPLVNGIEMFRNGLFPAEVITYWSASYLVVSALASVVIGCFIFSSFRSSEGD